MVFDCVAIYSPPASDRLVRESAREQEIFQSPRQFLGTNGTMQGRHKPLGHWQRRQEIAPPVLQRSRIEFDGLGIVFPGAGHIAIGRQPETRQEVRPRVAVDDTLTEPLGQSRDTCAAPRLSAALVLA